MADDRVVCAVVGTDALPYLPLGGGTLGDGANLALGTAAGTRIGTATSQKLGFWNAGPVARPGPYTQSLHGVDPDAWPPTRRSSRARHSPGIATGQAGTPYAQVADLNSLRAAYENLRQFAENIAQVLNALINDLRPPAWPADRRRPPLADSRASGEDPACPAASISIPTRAPWPAARCR